MGRPLKHTCEQTAGTIHDAQYHSHTINDQQPLLSELQTMPSVPELSVILNVQLEGLGGGDACYMISWI